MSTHPSSEQLGAYLDGELDAASRAAVDAHLRECAECGAHVADLSAVDDAARRVPLGAPEGYFDDFAPRVRARIEKKAPARWRPPVWGWAAAAALVLAVITPLALEQRRDAPAAAVPAFAPTSPVPDVAADAPAELEGDARAGFKKNDAPAGRPAVPPATVVAPLVLEDRQQELRSEPPTPRLARRDRDQGRDAGSGTPLPAAPAAAAPELRADTQPKREAAAEPAQPASETAKLTKEKPDEEQLENLRALGYVAPPPPAANQRQHGPRAQNTAPAAPYAAEPKDKAQAADAVAEKKTTDTVPEKAAGAVSTTGTTMQESVDVSPRMQAVGSGLASAKFRSLAESDPPRSDGDARALREAWRAFVAENPAHPQADEARVRLVEAGALAYRLGRQPRDREIAERDARAYLERPATPRADRVRAALRSLAP